MRIDTTLNKDLKKSLIVRRKNNIIGEIINYKSVFITHSKHFNTPTVKSLVIIGFAN